MIDRRAFLRASLAVACAPMIVRASSLMRLPVRPKPLVVLGMDTATGGDFVVLTEVWKNFGGSGVVHRYYHFPNGDRHFAEQDVPFWPFAHEYIGVQKNSLLTEFAARTHLRIDKIVSEDA